MEEDKGRSRKIKTTRGHKEDIKTRAFVNVRVKEVTDESVHLKELESLCLKSLGGQRGERVPQTLFTETQHFTFPQSRVCMHEHTTD